MTAKAVEGGSEANAEQFRRRRLSVVQRTIMGPAAAAPSASPASSSPRRGSGGGLTGMFRRRRNSASASAPSDSSAAPSTSAPSGGVFSGLFRRRKLSVVGQTIEDGAAAAQQASKTLDDRLAEAASDALANLDPTADAPSYVDPLANAQAAVLTNRDPLASAIDHAPGAAGSSSSADPLSGTLDWTSEFVPLDPAKGGGNGGKARKGSISTKAKKGKPGTPRAKPLTESPLQENAGSPAASPPPARKRKGSSSSSSSKEELKANRFAPPAKPGGGSSGPPQPPQKGVSTPRSARLTKKSSSTSSSSGGSAGSSGGGGGSFKSRRPSSDDPFDTPSRITRSPQAGVDLEHGPSDLLLAAAPAPAVAVSTTTITPAAAPEPSKIRIRGSSDADIPASNGASVPGLNSRPGSPEIKKGAQHSFTKARRGSAPASLIAAATSPEMRRRRSIIKDGDSFNKGRATSPVRRNSQSRIAMPSYRDTGSSSSPSPNHRRPSISKDALFAGKGPRQASREGLLTFGSVLDAKRPLSINEKGSIDDHDLSLCYYSVTSDDTRRSLEEATSPVRESFALGRGNRRMSGTRRMSSSGLPKISSAGDLSVAGGELRETEWVNPSENGRRSQGREINGAGESEFELRSTISRLQKDDVSAEQQPNGC